MSIDAVGAVNYSKPKKTGLVKGTVVAGTIGAGVYGTGALGLQYFLKKKPEILKDLSYSSIRVKALFKNPKNILHKFVNYALKIQNEMFKTVKSGKFDWKYAGKYAGFGAAVFAATYLAYRGIKALFTNGNKA